MITNATPYQVPTPPADVNAQVRVDLQAFFDDLVAAPGGADTLTTFLQSYASVHGGSSSARDLLWFDTELSAGLASVCAVGHPAISSYFQRIGAILQVLQSSLQTAGL